MGDEPRVWPAPAPLLIHPHHYATRSSPHDLPGLGEKTKYRVYFKNIKRSFLIYLKSLDYSHVLVSDPPTPTVLYGVCLTVSVLLKTYFDPKSQFVTYGDES